jgi:hypothetical protein
MMGRTSLGDLITALYDAATEVSDGAEANTLVTACTIDVLLRLRRRRLIEELAHPSARPVN